MTPKANTIDTLRGLGYTVGFAHGSVAVEEEALAVAQNAAAPDVVIDNVRSVTAMTMGDLANTGALADLTDEQKKSIAEKIAASALEEITVRVTEKVAFHERALAIAQASPDVWRVEQHVDVVEEDSVRVVSMMVATKADGTGWDADNQAILDSLANTETHADRVFQAQNPEAMQAAATLQADGKDVSRDAGTETFTVDGQTLDPAAIVQLADDGTSAQGA